MTKGPELHFLPNSWEDWNENLKTTDISQRSGERIWRWSSTWMKIKSKSGSRTSEPRLRRAAARKVNWPRCWQLKDSMIIRQFQLKMKWMTVVIIKCIEQNCFFLTLIYSLTWLSSIFVHFLTSFCSEQFLSS